MLRSKRIFLLSVFFIEIILNNGYENGWKCKTDIECTANGSKCIENNCKCGTAHIYNSNMTKCLKVANFYEQECEDTVQCSAYLWSGGTCELKSDNEDDGNSKKGICVCGKEYHYLHGRCYRSSGLGEKCITNEECYVNSDFEASSCKDGICKCSNGFYKREYRTCRRESGLGESCLIDQDCKLNNTKCGKELKCISDKQYETFPLNSNRVDIKQTIFSTLGKNCQTDENCTNNTICGPDLTCICKRAYFNFNEQCIPELGEPCLETDMKMIKDSVCRNGKWACEIDKVVSKNNRFCREVTKEIQKSCLHNEQCYIFGPDAKCYEKQCVCDNDSHYVEKELFCWRKRGIGENCTSNYDCHLPDSEFRLYCKNNSVCSCPEGTLAKKTSCVKIPTGINANCKKPEDCKIRNGTCIANVCSCFKNFIPFSNDNCIEVSSYGNKCDHHIQCNATLTNGICSRKSENSTSGICSCADTDHYNNGKCFRKKFLGDICQNESECFLEKNINRIKCTNGICSCDRNYKESSDKKCTKIGTNGGSAVFYLPFWIGLIATVCNLLIF